MLTYQLNRVEAVQTQILDEVRVHSHLNQMPEED
jgi:hypothetical protein